jgi:hypothetical protein
MKTFLSVFALLLTALTYASGSAPKVIRAVSDFLGAA